MTPTSTRSSDRQGDRQALQADPLFAPHILETLKMQGVDQLGDFAIQIRLKMMTKPGEQFVIRRKALAMIKKAFDGQRHRLRLPDSDGGGRGRRSGIRAVAQHALDWPTGLAGGVGAQQNDVIRPGVDIEAEDKAA